MRIKAFELTESLPKLEKPKATGTSMNLKRVSSK